MSVKRKTKKLFVKQLQLWGGSDKPSWLPQAEKVLHAHEDVMAKPQKGCKAICALLTGMQLLQKLFPLHFMSDSKDLP